MTFIIKIVGFTNGRPHQCNGQYLLDHNVNEFGGRGYFTTTDDPRTAETFPSMADALAAWQEQSEVLPYRPDRKPNRPLTALNILVEEFKSCRTH